MLTRLGSRALSALGYSSNGESAENTDEIEFDDSRIISGDWVFVREKRPQRSCTKRNSNSTEEWFTVTSSRKRNKIKPESEDVKLEYDTMDDLSHSEENIKTKRKNNSQDTSGFVENQNEQLDSVGKILTRNQRKLMTATEESKVMLERGTKTKRQQNASLSNAHSGRIESKRQNKVLIQADSNKRGRRRHMMPNTYSGKGGRRGS